MDQISKNNKIVVDQFHDISLQKQSIVTKTQALGAAKERILNQLQVLKERQSKLQKELCKNFVRHEQHFRWTAILFSINIASPKQHQKKLIVL